MPRQKSYAQRAEEAKVKFWGTPVPDHLPHGRGSWASRAYGCDCQTCLPSGRRPRMTDDGVPLTAEARRAWEERRDLSALKYLKHGPNSHPYRAYSCDCQECLPSGRRRAVREDRPLTKLERQRRSKENLAGQPVPPDVKHGGYAYRVYRCRCDVCRKQHREEMHKRRWAWLKKAYGRYDVREDVTIVHWPPRNAGPDWTCPDCGEGAP